MPIQPVTHRIGDSDIKLPLDNADVLAALQKGNIKDVHRVLSENRITNADLEEFAAIQHSKYMSVLQTEPIYSLHNEVPPPDIEMNFPIHSMEFRMSREDTNLVNDLFAGSKMMSAEGKDSSRSMSGGKTMGKSTAIADELNEAESDLTNVQTFLDTFENSMILTQVEIQGRNNMAEAQRKLQELLALARSGGLDDVTPLILAIAKCSITADGNIFAKYGTKMRMEMQQQKVATELMQGNPYDSATLMKGNLMIKESTQNMTQITSLLNQSVQHVQTVLGASKSMMDAYANLKSEMIRRLSPT